MPICSACGRESPEGFQHCGFCGASLLAPAVERRTLATLVFCDLSGSTALGERVDPESVTELLRSYFQEMRTVIERHGGIVEKFIGDAVVAAFGILEVHEDDALRACHAALEMQQRMVDLNAGHERRFGTRIAARIGVNTGEVVTGGAMGAETFAIGDAVNVAARLEQAAAPGEILLGEPTFRLVRDAVRVEAIEPLSAKGKSQPVEAYRLVEVGDVGSTPSPRPGTPFAGRHEELRLLERELESTVAECRCRLVTILGEPGVGKSRLVAEFLARVEATDTRIARGRCLPYGEGITFWAVGEVVRDLAGIRDEHSVAEAHALVGAHLAGAANANVVAAKVAQLLGLADGVATAEETAWAIRAFLSSSSGSGPLVVLVEDIHWAEPALLDLLAGLEAAAIDSPVLLVCPARPELLEQRPSWEVALRLEPLGSREVDTLLTGMLGATPETVRLRLAHASAGNPLFAEEMVAMLLDDGALRIVDGACTVDGDLAAFALPASLHAILAARLDRLRVEERATVARAAVEGEVFHRGAVEELSESAAASVAQSLDTLTRKDFVRPADAAFTGETAFRFKHILVRDVAYRTTTKRLRAVFHEQFAAWLERVAGDRVVQYEEILGHHLEQAYGLRVELGLADEETAALGERAAGRLASGGRRALARGDRGAAVNLLRRAAALIPERSRDRVEVAIDLVEPLAGLGMFAKAKALADEAAETAVALGDECIAARLDVERTWLAVYAQVDDFAVASALDHTSAAMAVFERAGDDVGLARAQELDAMVHYYYGGLSEAALASEQGLVHAERAHDLQRQAQHRLVRMHAAQGGFTPLRQVNHRDARAHEARDREHRDAGPERKGGVGVAQVVKTAQRFDAGGRLSRLRVTTAEDAEVDSASSRVREQGRVLGSWKPVERLERDRLEWRSTGAQPCLGVLSA